MSEKIENSLKQEIDRIDRRKRVNRMKKGFFTMMSVWMLVSMVLCVALFIKVIHLEDTLKEVSANLPQVEQVEHVEKQNSPKADESGEISVGEKEATQQKKNLAENGEQLKVYLTFDDGPSTNTEAILDILDKYNVKATFFVIGKTDELSKELYKKIVDKGHTLGMHSYSHKYSVIYDSLEAFEQDIQQIHDYLYEVTGVDCKYYRFPGGSSNQVSNSDMTQFIRYLNERGITYYDWNVSSGDATSQAYTADELIQNVMGDVAKYKTSVVLMHDSAAKPTTVEALSSLIEQLQGMGAEILPIDEETTPIQHVTIDTQEQEQ